MKKYEAILFDLDGTLLPMDNDEFTKEYLGLLSNAVAPYGYKADVLIPAMWRGVEAMVKNDGNCLNSERFWTLFSQMIGKDTTKDIPKFDALRNDFCTICRPQTYNGINDQKRSLICQTHLIF